MPEIARIEWDWLRLHAGVPIKSSTPRARKAGFAGRGFSLDNVDRKVGFAAQRDGIPLVVTLEDGIEVKFLRDTSVPLSEQIAEHLPRPTPAVEIEVPAATGRRFLIGRPGWVRTIETDSGGATTDYKNRPVTIVGPSSLRQRRNGSVWYRSSGQTGRPSWKKYKP